MKSTITAAPPTLLKAEEVAEMLNVSTDWVYDHASRKQPRIPCVRMGRG